MTQLGVPFLGLPALTVSTGLLGRTPVGVQIVAARFREDLCLAAGGGDRGRWDTGLAGRADARIAPWGGPSWEIRPGHRLK
jgi:hypothetical protein